MAAWSPDGQTLAVATSIGIYLYNSETLTAEAFWETQHPADSPAWSPDGTRLAAAITSRHEESSVIVWDIPSGEPMYTLEGGFPLWSPDGTRLATSEGNVVVTWDMASGKALRAIQGLADVYHKQWSPDGTRLAIGDNNGVVVIWDAKDGGVLQSFNRHTRELADVEWSPDGTRLASASYDGTAIVWDATRGEAIHTFTRLGGWFSVAWSPDGTRVAGASFGRVSVWDASSGEEVLAFRIYQFGSERYAFQAEWSPDGKRLVSQVRLVDGDNVLAWDVASGRELFALGGDNHFLSLSPDGTRLATLGPLGWSLSIWDAFTGTKLASHGVMLIGDDLEWLPDSTRLATGMQFFGSGDVRVWDVNTGASLLAIDVFSRGIALSPDGARLAVKIHEGGVRIYDTTSAEVVQMIDFDPYGHGGDLAWSPDGTQLAVAWSQAHPDRTVDDMITIWDVASGNVFHTLPTSGWRDAGQLIWFADGKRLASAYFDWGPRIYWVGVWDIATESMQQEIHPPEAAGLTMALSPDGARLAIGTNTASDLHDVVIWDVESGERIYTLQGHVDEIRSLAWAPNGDLLASGGWNLDKAVIIWDTTNGTALHMFDIDDSVDAIAWSPDGTRLALSYLDGTVRIWGLRR